MDATIRKNADWAFKWYKGAIVIANPEYVSTSLRMMLKHIAVVALAIVAHFYVSPIPEFSTVKLVVSYFAANAVIIVYLFFATSYLSQLDKFTFLVSLNLTFNLTATILTLTRRVFFSPLRHFPGPTVAAASKLWAANEYRLGRHSLSLRELHRKYDSDFIRIGPNEISIRNVDAVGKIYKGKYVRGSFYEIGCLNGDLNVNFTRDYQLHSVWRRIWERAFLTSEFKDYNPRVEYHVDTLIEILRGAEGKEINCTKLVGNLLFDIMADLSFATDGGLQKGTGDSLYMDFIHKYMVILSLVGSLRNLCQLLPYLPQPPALKAFRLKGDKMLADRQKLGSARKDIFRHLLAEDAETGCMFTQSELNSNANFVIVAGSDTTSSVLTQALGVLARDARIQTKLKAEIDALEGRCPTVENTKNLTFLNAIVYEATRLFNPLPVGVQAATPPEGVTVAGVYVPGNVQVVVSHLVLMTDPRYFVDPEEFIPERWTGERDDLVLNRSAFIPFGYGVHSCIGKQLALNELRLVLARVVGEFDLSVGESHDEDGFRDAWRDFVVVQVGPMWIKFLPRKI